MLEKAHRQATVKPTCIRAYGKNGGCGTNALYGTTGVNQLLVSGFISNVRCSLLSFFDGNEGIYIGQ